MELFPIFREFPFVIFSPSEGVPLNYSRETLLLEGNLLGDFFGND